MKQTHPPHLMTTKQIQQVKDIATRLIKGADFLCNGEDQKRAYYQGARRMIHALYMNGLIELDDKHSIMDPIDKEIDKILES